MLISYDEDLYSNCRQNIYIYTYIIYTLLKSYTTIMSKVSTALLLFGSINIDVTPNLSILTEADFLFLVLPRAMHVCVQQNICIKYS